MRRFARCNQHKACHSKKCLLAQQRLIRVRHRLILVLRQLLCVVQVQIAGMLVRCSCVIGVQTVAIRCYDVVPFSLRLLPAIMFDFLFKRVAKKPPVKSPADKTIAPAESAKPLYDARTAARHRAESLQHDETGSLVFLLQCEFAEARLIAAQAIHAKSAVQQALDATRNNDRRVARLMQARLEVLVAQDKLAQQCAECSAEALRLVRAPRLTPNQVGELDRRWQGLLPVPDSMQHSFDQPRQLLAERLAAQAALQRSAIDALARLKQLAGQALELPIDAVRDTLECIEATLANCRAASEISALPKHLLDQCTEAAQGLRDSLAVIAQQHAARAIRTALLEQWEALAPSSHQHASLQRAWAALPVAGAAAVSQQRFDTLLERVIASQPAPTELPLKTAAAAPTAAQQALFVPALQAIEDALEQGMLQAAAEADKRIRALDLSALHPSVAQTAQLSRLRAELGRLQGWARWGGNISREELQKAAEALAAQQLSISELAKKIGSLRERWKSLDISAGPAPKELWHGFDAACTVAYGPVAAHFEKLSAERQKNAATAIALIAEINRCADQLPLATPDWKSLAQFCQRCSQNWQRLGSTDRREKKHLDSEFSAALERLHAPLSAVRERETAQREKLIEQAEHLLATERGALDTLKALQERWQECARSMPLERRQEQELWQRFKAASDAAFARRKEVAVTADAERQRNLQARQILCAELEAALAEDLHDTAAVPRLTTLLRESAETWSRPHAVPRSAEAALESRYRQAVTGLTQRIDIARQTLQQAGRQALRDKLVLCQQAEAAIVAGAPVETVRTQWQALGTDRTPLEQALCRRVDRILQMLPGAVPAYRAQLLANRTDLLRELLRTEIVLSIDSPPEYARERLQLQVEVLQSALTSGAPLPTVAQRLSALCERPALLAPADSARLLRIVDQLAG